MQTTDQSAYSLLERAVHLSLAAFGVSAFLTGEWAESGTAGTGYLIHAWLGLSLAAAILLRALEGVAGRPAMRFGRWSPLARRQWAMAAADLKGLVKLQVPQRGMHEGLAGLVQACGLAVFAWMGATGTLMYFLNGRLGHDAWEVLEEIHELGESLVPVYLLLHVGAVLLHSLGGSPVWRKMFSLQAVPRESRGN